ncbi:MAG: diguanylate cyclase [Hylemonella sp.]|nr:diguanylate cyclase [Hylemonella sp.]
MNPRSLLRILVSGVLLLALMLGWLLYQSHGSAVKRGIDDADNLAGALQGQFTATLRRIDANLHSIAAQLPPDALNQKVTSRYRAQIEAILKPYGRNFPEVNGYFVWDGDGEYLYDTTSIPPTSQRRNIGTRAGFQHLKLNPDVAIAFSDSIRGVVTGQTSVAVYVPVRDARGRLQAVVTATLNLERIAQGLEQLQTPAGSVVFMRRSDDHKLVIRHPFRDSELNKPVRNAIQQRIDAGEMAGRDRFRAVTDGEYRLYGFRKLEGYPFYMVVGLAERGLLAEWRRNVVIVVSGLLLMTLALGFALWRVNRIERLRLDAQREAQEAHELLQEAIDSMSAGIIIYDPSDRLVMRNQAVLDIYGTLKDQIEPGKTFEEITRAGIERGVFDDAKGREEQWLAERTQRHKSPDGKPHELALDNGHWLLYSEHRTPGGYIVGSRIDITERKRLEVELREQATTDALTGLPNRRHFLRRLEDELERVRRRTTSEACVLMLDLDHFKRINDQYGHAAGDSLLRHFSNLLRNELRATDTAGRMGGEEFAVILPGSALQAALGFAQRVCGKLAEHPMSFGGHEVGITVSIGVASISDDDLSADAVLSRADRALYQAKDGGRNRVELADKPA